MNNDEVFPLETIGNPAVGTLNIVDCPFGARTEPALRPGRYTRRVFKIPGKSITPRPANGPGLARLCGMSGPSGENNTVNLYYEPLDAGTLDRLLALRPLEIEELVTLARSLHEAIETLRAASADLLTALVVGAPQIVARGVSIVTQGIVYAAPNTTIAVLVVSTLLNSLIQAAILPFDSAVVALMYTDLRMRSEGLDVELRHAAGV